MGREEEFQELDRAYREYAETMDRQQRAEAEYAASVQQLARADDAQLRAFNTFLDKVFR